MTYNKNMKSNQLPQVIVETVSYLKAVEDIWDEETQIDFKNYISLHPDKGDIIPGTGGIRKIRWQSSGHGKRGGARIIYYVYNEACFKNSYLMFKNPLKEQKATPSCAA